MRYSNTIMGLTVLATAALPMATLAADLNVGTFLPAEVGVATPVIAFNAKNENKAQAAVAAKLEKLDKKANAEQRKGINGTVTAIATSTVTVKANNGGTYIVSTEDADIRRRFGATMTLADIQVNDHVVVKGTVDGNTVDAKSIQDLSLQARHGTFSGKVTAVASSSNSFTLKSNNRGSQTVVVSASTTIKKNGDPMHFSDIMVGAVVRVSGVWNRVNNLIYAKAVQIIAPLYPIRITGTVTVKSDTSLSVLAINTTTYTVDAKNAVVVRQYFGRTNLAEVKVGDRVTVWGKHERASTAIKAHLIHDLSLSRGVATSTPSTTTSSPATTSTPTGSITSTTSATST